MQPSDESSTKKRKACQACIRAKAKCSPSTERIDLCYRCQRLGKECVFEESVRKRGPKSRSRVKQLEQRVDSLIGLLAANGQNVNDLSERTKGVFGGQNTNENTHPPSTSDASEGARQHTPIDTPEEPFLPPPDTGPFEAYDPVEAGHINEAVASRLLDEFKESFTSTFPFVIVPANIDAATLRKTQPFLFLAIMTVTTYRTPLVQRALSTQLKGQIAARIIERSHKSLEILQGMLVYGGWYHFFYRPSNQQLAALIQLCVAMVQDLALSKNPRNKERKLRIGEDQFSMSATGRTSAGERAFLGTYYLSCGFAQAWRKRATMQHTRYMAQCAERASTRLEYPSDALIAPLIQLSELMCRVNNFFSYDDIDNTDIKGDLMLEMSTSNFCTELDRILEKVPQAVKNNPIFDVNFRLLGIWIHECGLHTTLWPPTAPGLKPSISPTRLRILYRCLNATTSYINAVLAIPNSSLHHLASPPWAAWFYAIVVACKLVFLEENERDPETDIDPHQEVTRLMTESFDKSTPNLSFPLSTEAVTGIVAKPTWDPVSVAKETDIQNLFDRFVKKMQFTLPANSTAMENEDFDPLFCMTCLQLSLSHGYAKRIKEYLEKANNVAVVSNNNPLSAPGIPYSTPQQPGVPAPLPHQYNPAQMPPHDPTVTPMPMQPNPVPMMNTFNFNSLNFDNIAMPDPEQPLQPMYDDWLWDLVMDDFSMPPL